MFFQLFVNNEGKVLGPILFIIYINRFLNLKINSTILSQYADYTVR